uniref:Abnormal spindle microtubule assembly n=1 Tax=Zosterops lateralis melanops TaxID=1220523 RepID=A0A8D2NT29_ZOSLA
MHRDLKQYLCVKQNVIKIQAWYRCQLARRVYQEYRAKIVTIQQYYRAYKLGKAERESYLQKRAAVIILQAAFRGMKARELYRQAKAARVIQAKVLGQRQRQEYIQLQNAAVRLQALWRGKAVRKIIQKKHHHATIIQSYYRMHINQLKYKKLRQATLVIQKYYRAAVLALQSAYRGMTVRRQRNKLNKAATTIQAAFKSYLGRCIKPTTTVHRIKAL